MKGAGSVQLFKRPWGQVSVNVLLEAVTAPLPTPTQGTITTEPGSPSFSVASPFSPSIPLGVPSYLSTQGFQVPPPSIDSPPLESSRAASPAILTPGTDFVEDSFSIDPRWVWWFRDDPSAFIMHFISHLISLLI